MIPLHRNHVAAVLLLLGTTCAGGAQPTPAPAPAPTVVAPPGPGAPIEDERNTIAVFRAAAPATVHVTQNQLVRDRRTWQPVEVPAGTGTGFVWDADGHVVTNFHVVDGARSLTVTLFDGTSWPATVVGGDPRKDIAVLRISPPAGTLVPLSILPEGIDLEVGQKALAIGNPFGLDHTLTTGVISALGREIAGYGQVTIKGMIQTDASINPGNSGGPLLDSSGRLIGMNTMIFSQSGQSAGIGFAVPVATVRRVVTQIVATGKVEVVGIGVTLVPDPAVRRVGVHGVAILEVTAGSPAEAAGIHGVSRTERGIALGDVIVSVDGVDVRSYDDLYNAFDTRHAGEVAKIGVLRDGKVEVLPVPLVVVSD
jgi:S1-C subfamily serine protease